MSKILKSLVLLVGVCLFLNGCGTDSGKGKLDDTNSNVNSSDADIESEGNDSVEDSEVNVELVSGQALFSTEYAIEDYCQGLFLVSKNNELLYGVLDMMGNEVIPVKYDDMEFLNKGEVGDDVYKKLYIKAEYEGMEYIFDSKGESLLSATEIGYVLNEHMGTIYFYRQHEAVNNLALYNEKGESVASFSSAEEDEKITEIAALAGNAYLLEMTNGIAILNEKFEIQQLVDGVTISNRYVYDEESHLYGNQYGVIVKYEINENAQVSMEIKYDDIEEFWSALKIENEIWTSYISKTNLTLGNAFLYESNNTWKLIESETGAPLYDERYYDCFIEDGTYWLMNEDNQLCVIDKQANMIIEYGALTLVDKNFYYKGEALSSNGGKYLVGDDGIAIIETNGDVSTVYFYFDEISRENWINGVKNKELLKEEFKEMLIEFPPVTGNLLENSGFEVDDYSMWKYYVQKIDGNIKDQTFGYEVEINEGAPLGVVNKPEDSYESDNSLHFWNDVNSQFWCEQTITRTVPKGTYTASLKIQGDEVGSGAKIYMYVIVDGQKEYYSDNVEVSGWQEWKTVTIDNIEISEKSRVVVGIYIKHAANGWGTIDDFYFGLK